MDLQGSIPCFIHITEGRTHDVNILDELILEPGAFYIMDRAYIDFRRLYTFTQGLAFFVVRAKSNLDYSRLAYRHIDKTTGLRADQTIALRGPKSSEGYPAPLRRISYFDTETHKRLVFLTNNFDLPAISIARLYKCRWQVELFFKWIKQYLRIKAFYGTSENAVKTQIWIAICVYVLVAIVKKELKIERSLGEILQILSITLFERSPIDQALTATFDQYDFEDYNNQLSLFDF
jgi:transposase